MRYANALWIAEEHRLEVSQLVTAAFVAVGFRDGRTQASEAPPGSKSPDWLARDRRVFRQVRTDHSHLD